MTFNYRKTRNAFVLASGLAVGLIGIALTAEPLAAAEQGSQKKGKAAAAERADTQQVNRPTVYHKTVKIDGVYMF